MVKKYSWSKQDFEALIHTISSLHISRSMVTLQNIPDFSEKCGWIKAKAALPLKNMPTRQEAKQLTLIDHPRLLNPVSARWSSARLNYQPRSVLSGVLFGEPPRALMDLPVVDSLVTKNDHDAMPKKGSLKL